MWGMTPEWEDITSWKPTYNLPERAALADLLQTPEGRAKYRAWQIKEYEAIVLLKELVGRRPLPNCSFCKGVGKVPLFTSLVDCPACKPRDPILIPGLKLKDLSEHIKNPKSRRMIVDRLREMRDLA